MLKNSLQNVLFCDIITFASLKIDVFGGVVMAKATGFIGLGNMGSSVLCGAMSSGACVSESTYAYSLTFSGSGYFFYIPNVNYIAQ